jgi:hypothetical protein
MSNQETFELALPVILNKLADEFPNPITLQEHDFNQNTTNEISAIYCNTIQYLIHEGVIRGKLRTPSPFEFQNVVLTSKGRNLLEVRDTSPTTPNQNNTLRELVRIGTQEAIKAAVRLFYDNIGSIT